MTDNLFVYGTLKRGCSNHHYLNKDSSKFIGEYQTKACYRLLSNGVFPGLIEDINGYPVTGEIWKVTKGILSLLDHHEMLYHRTLIKIDGLDDVQGYLYDAWPDPKMTECRSGIWLES